MQTRDSIFTIPADQSFGLILAGTLLKTAQSNPIAFSKTLILLPTRRACRNLRNSFLKLTEGKPLLLPRIQPLGDVDEEELAISISAAHTDNPVLDIPPAISPLRRQLSLARLIMAQGAFAHTMDQAMQLADALGQFLDQIIIEELDIHALVNIVPEEFASHWQITLEFLTLISAHWPAILAEQNLIDASERRKRLMDALTQHWQDTPPQFPVIAAGSTGSIPATARLLKTVSNLPQGHVILPGLDLDMDENSWDILSASHPQSGMKKLLTLLEIDRQAVGQYPSGASRTTHKAPRRAFINEIMRPAETTQQWANLKNNAAFTLDEALQDFTIIPCETARQEAETIAMLFREILHTSGKTAALVTPDRTLARRTAKAAQRWGIHIDDSAGKPLRGSPAYTFAKLAIDLLHNDFSPIALLSLLKHPYCNIGLEPTQYHISLTALDLALRGLMPQKGLNGIRAALKNNAHYAKDADIILDALEPAYSGAVKKHANSLKSSTYDIIQAHKTLLEVLNEPHDDPSHKTIWSGEDGESLADLFITMETEATLIGNIDLQTYTGILDLLATKAVIRPKYDSHPRLLILGQLEARLIDTDVIILGSLNEGTWPPEPAHDPWMSRPMRQTFGLPDPEKSIGLAAHDFVQCACAKEVYITRSQSQDGSPKIPSRWLQRLETVIDSIDPTHTPKLWQSPYTSWLKTLDTPDLYAPAQRPAPTPKATHRPKQLSVTRIETLLRDPYSIYARHVLKLKKLDPLEKQIDAAELGNLLHDILETFCKAHPKSIPNNAKDILLDIAQDALSNIQDKPELWSFWKPRFDTVIDWYLEQEKNWRQNFAIKALEQQGRMTLQNNTFTLTCKADRIDLQNDGNYAVIDYKSGGSYSQKSMKNGEKPQLALEGLILQHGGFENLPAAPVSTLSYWLMPGGHTPGKTLIFNDPKNDIDDLENHALQSCLEDTYHKLETVIGCFSDPDTPYLCCPRAAFMPAYNDYEHLARIQEWSADDNTEGDV